tara:strand:- start:1 stop:342 length:342 start_codon:yes stop_codon:yes gene_type:complete
VGDNFKWLGVLALILGGLWAFYAFADESLLFRVLGLLAVIGVAGALGLQTEKGRQAWGFAREARTEVRKVVWPTRKETVQTTGLIMAMVGLVAVFLWGLDSFLGWLTKLLLGS